jgi:hypothetical protein
MMLQATNLAILNALHGQRIYSSALEVVGAVEGQGLGYTRIVCFEVVLKCVSIPLVILGMPHMR